MKSKSLTLFIISVVIYSSVLALALFWQSIGLGEKNLVVLGFCGTVGFGISIAGLIVGITEIPKAKSRKSWIGLIGNLIVTLFLVYSMIEAIMINK